MERSSSRQSNFELLRIIAMVMIVGSHFASHGVVNTLNSPGGNIGQYLTGTFVNKLFVCTLQPGGTVGVAIFFLISGYFLVKKESAHFLKIVFEGVYYGLLCGIIAFLLRFTHVAEFISYGQILQGFLVSVTSGKVWWFISVYILLMLMVPYLNEFIINSSRKLLVVTMLITWIFPYCLDIFFGGIFTSIVKGIFYYLLGSYIRLYPNNRKKHLSKRAEIIAFIISWTLYTTCFYLINENYFQSYIVNQIVTTLGESVYTLICSTCLFLFVKDCKFHSKSVNLIAKTTFGMYLISDYPPLRMFIWENIWHVQNLYVIGKLFVIKGILIIVATCLACGFIDFVRITAVEPRFIKVWQNIFKKLNLVN